jgi:hypothetical protein
MEINMNSSNFLETVKVNNEMSCLFYHDGCFKLICPTENNWMPEAISYDSFTYLRTLSPEKAVLKVKEVIFNWLAENSYLDKYVIIDLNHIIFKQCINNETISAIREYKINQILDDK